MVKIDDQTFGLSNEKGITGQIIIEATSIEEVYMCTFWVGSSIIKHSVRARSRKSIVTKLQRICDQKSMNVKIIYPPNQIIGLDQES